MLNRFLNHSERLFLSILLNWMPFPVIDNSLIATLAKPQLTTRGVGSISVCYIQCHVVIPYRLYVDMCACALYWCVCVFVCARGIWMCVHLCVCMCMCDVVSSPDPTPKGQQAQESAQCVPDPFLLLGVGSRDETMCTAFIDMV